MKLMVRFGKWMLTHQGLFRQRRHVSTNGRYAWLQWDRVL